MNDEILKEQVKTYWNRASCGTENSRQEKFSLLYFEEIEDARYSIEPEIFSFAQFPRFRNKKILEVGIGAGTDFLQWVRAGAQSYGVDITQEAIDNVKHRLDRYALEATDVRVADAEHLPYPSHFFDLVYSWGVIHHSPRTIRCLEEIIRVAKPGGSIKIMIYNRRSLFAYYRWIREALFRGKPFQSLTTILWHYQESIGTKAYTFREVKRMLRYYPVTIKRLNAPVTQHDLLYYKAKPFRWLAYFAACLLGFQRCGWFMQIELQKDRV